MQKIVGARPANNAVGIQAEGTSDGFAQFYGRAVGIILQMRGGGLVDRDDARTRPERRFVRRQLEHFGGAWRAALAGHVGLDVEHAGPGFWTQCTHYPRTPNLLLVLPLSERSVSISFLRAPYSGSRDCRRGPR